MGWCGGLAAELRPSFAKCFRKLGSACTSRSRCKVLQDKLPSKRITRVDGHISGTSKIRYLGSKLSSDDVCTLQPSCYH